MRTLLATATAILTVAAPLVLGAEPGEPRIATADWPCWQGPDGSGFAVGCGNPLVDDLSEMRLVWRSEEQGIPANCWHNETQGGYDSPIVANGKVFISYFKGTGDILDKSIQSKGMSEERLRWCQAVVTEDTVLCVDARTGKTLWKQVMGEGINLYQRRKGGPHQSTCWNDSKVFAQSTLARVYCLNDADGKVIWQADGTATPHLLKVQAAYKKAGMQHPYRGVEQPELEKVGEPELCMMPLAVADGVVVADGGGKVVAFETASGKPVAWKTGFSTRGRSGLVPLRWTCDGKEYFILGNTCVRPRTGETVWQVKDAGGGSTPTIGDGYIVLPGPRGGYVCGRIGTNGFSKVWENNDYGGSGAMASIGVIHKGWFYAEVHTAGGRAKMPEGATELAIGIELATGRVVGPQSFPGVSQTLCTSPVGMDGRWFFHVGAGYSGMVMMDTDPTNFKQVGLRMPTIKSWMPLPGGSRTKEKLDYCLTSTPAMAGGKMYFRGSDSLYCYDLRRPSEAELTVLRQTNAKLAQGVVDGFRAGKIDATTAIQELNTIACGHMAEPLLAEEMRKALDASDARRFRSLAAASTQLRPTERKTLSELVGQALASGRIDLAIAAMDATNVMAGVDADKAKPLLIGFLKGNETKAWGPASEMLRSMDTSSDEVVVQAMSRFGKQDKASTIIAAVDVLGAVAGSSRNAVAGKAAIEALIHQLDSKDLTCQRAAIARLGALGPKALAARKKLDELAELPDLAKDVEIALERIAPVKKIAPGVDVDLPPVDP